MTPDWPRLRIDGPAIYVVRVAGQVDPSCADILAGMSIATDEDGTTLSGRVADQAALLGVLNALGVLGHEVLSIECLGPARDRP